MQLLQMQRMLSPASGAPGAPRRASSRPSSSAAATHPPAPLQLSSFSFSRLAVAPPPPQIGGAARPSSAPAGARSRASQLSAARSSEMSTAGRPGGGAAGRPAASAAAATATATATATAFVATADVIPAKPSSAAAAAATTTTTTTTHQVRRRRPRVDETPPAPPEFLARYALGELLGRGASASVYAAIDRETGAVSAAKLLPRRVGGPRGRDRSPALAAEVAASRALQAARGAARLCAVFEGEDAVAIVSELLPGGDLSDLLAHSPQGRLAEREAAVAARLALGFVADAHALGFVVGDVKPQNFALRGLYPSARHLADPLGHPDRGVLDPVAIDFGCCVDYGALAAAREGGDGGASASLAAAAVAAAARSPSASPSASSSSSDDDEVCVVLPSLGFAGGGCTSASASASASPSASPLSSRSPSPSPLPSPSSLSPLISGTPIYMAPEVLRGCASPSSDVWACGVMLYELLTGQFPFWREPAHEVAALGARAVAEAINHGPVLFPRDPFSSAASGEGLKPSVQDLLLGMLRRDPARRLTSAQAAGHPWFAEVLGE